MFRELRLTAFEAQDIDTLHRWQQDPEFRIPLTGARFPMSRAQVCASIDALSTPAARPQRLAHAMRIGENLAGAAVLAEIDWLHRSATVAALAAPDAPDPSGLRAAGIARVMGMAFEALDLRRLEAQVEAGSADVAMYSQLGFEVEGRRRSAIFRAGARWDLVVFSRLKGSSDGDTARQDLEPPAVAQAFLP